MNKIVTLLLCISVGTLFGQPTQNRLQELNETYLEVKNDSLPYAREIIREALGLIDENVNSELLATTFRNAADLYYQVRNLDSADLFIEKASFHALKSGDSLSMVLVMSDMGLFAFQRNRYVVAQKHYLEALAIAERNEMTDQIEEINGRIGFMYTMEERFDEAFPYAKQYYERLKAKPSMDLVKATFNLANLLKRMERYEESLAYLDTMKVQVDSMDFVYGQGKMYGMRAYVLMEQGRYNEAEAAIISAKGIFSQLGIPGDLFQMELALANVELERKDYYAMDRQMKKVDQWVEAVQDDQELMLEYYDALYLSKKGIGDGTAALGALEQKTQLRDSIFSAQSAKQRDELIEKYETAKKDQEIASLAQEATIQSLRLKERNYQLLAGTFIAVLIVGFVVFSARQKAAKNQQIVAEVEQKLLRLQMNPHFIFNTLGVIQSVLNKNENEKAALYLTRFSKLMRQTLEFSREEFIPLEEELELLKNYIEIQRISTGQHFLYELNVGDDLDPFDVMVPPMFAQPFIENVFLHAGLNQKGDEGKLTVSFEAEASKLLLTIKDNGQGIKKADRDGHKSMATQITRDRLSLLSRKYKKDFGLEMSSSEDGTTVTLQLPLNA